MNYNINISKEKYTLAMLKVVNCFVNMTDYELDIIVKMIDNDIKVLTSESRAIIRKLTGGKSVGSTNNYIKRLVDKKILTYSKEFNGLTLNGNVIRPVLDKSVTISFNVN